MNSNQLNPENMILHITTHAAWQEAQAHGEYIAPSLSIEGFIHCSTFSQILPVAENFYKGQKELVLLVIDPALLASALQWEAPSEHIPHVGVPEGEKFPHVYGPINLNAVLKVVDFNENESGEFTLPAI